MAKKIFIGVGHGGADPGACNFARRESDDNLRLALLVKSKLLAQGQTVRLSRESDIAMTPVQRRQMAINWGADILLDIHRNSVADSSAKGIEIWVRYNKYSAGAATLLEHLAALPHQANRGVKIGSYAVLADTAFPAMLLELGFISNSKDNALFDCYLNDNSAAIATGILDILGEQHTPPRDAGDPPLYRVQVGAFGIKKNAEAFLQTVQDMGLQAFLIGPQQANSNE
jgi:N-acetylmuramoyl-L-alanine amidase